MVLHYFHISNRHTTLDSDGTDLPDLAAVQEEALRACRELMWLGGSTSELWSGETWKVWVTDQPDGAGPTILTLELLAS
jgi:hypothetical protein